MFVAVAAAETGFMPGLVFPFVKLHAVGATAACNESCFEMLATLLISWMRGEAHHLPLGFIAGNASLCAQSEMCVLHITPGADGFDYHAAQGSRQRG